MPAASRRISNWVPTTRTSLSPTSTMKGRDGFFVTEKNAIPELAAYKKYHRPIMDFYIQKGVVISSTLYAPKSHSPGMPWDFAIIIVSPPEGEAPKLGMTRAAVIRKLFPDIEDYVRGEKLRWSLTVNHWDEEFVELDVTRDPLSVYYPLDAPPK